MVLEQRAFITTWDTRMHGVSEDDQIKIDTQGDGFDYSVDWGDGSKDHHVTGDITHTYSSPGVYTIKITGDFPHFIMNESDEEQSSQVDENGNPIVVFVPNSDVKKLLSIEQWGDIVWTSMHSSFRGTELAITATDTPDLSNVTDMSYMFAASRIYGKVNDDWDNPTPVDLSQWNTGNVTNMSHLFFNAGISTYHTAFDYDITVVSGYEFWDVSSVIDMSFMFSGVVYLSANFDSWDVSQVTNMSGLFNNLYRFELALSEWDVSNVIDMSYMFSFEDNGDPFFFSYPKTISSLESWDVSSVTNMNSMFKTKDIRGQNLTDWNVSNVIDMSSMFAYSYFDGDLSDWDVSSVKSFSKMFLNTEFNPDISSWNVSSATDMSLMFALAYHFNQNISDWDVSGVKNMDYMFVGAESFDQNLSFWDVSNTTTMAYMFARYWIGDLDELVRFPQLLHCAICEAPVINYELGQWDVSSAENMTGMFSGNYSFDQDISDWDVSRVLHMNEMFHEVSLSNENYDALLLSWSNQSVQSSVRFDGGNSKYSVNSAAARLHLIEYFNWIITDAGEVEEN